MDVKMEDRGNGVGRVWAKIADNFAIHSHQLRPRKIQPPLLLQILLLPNSVKFLHFPLAPVHTLSPFTVMDNNQLNFLNERIEFMEVQFDLFHGALIQCMQRLESIEGYLHMVGDSGCNGQK